MSAMGKAIEYPGLFAFKRLSAHIEKRPKTTLLPLSGRLNQGAETGWIGEFSQRFTLR